MGMTTLRRRALLLTGCACLAGVALPARADPSPVVPIKQLNDGLLRVMKAGQGTPAKQRFDMLAPVIDQVFDLDAVLRTSVGSAWNSLPPDQQEMLRPVFRRYTVASYLNNFNTFTGQQFTVDPQVRPLGNGEQVVHTRITSSSGESHELDYVMRNTGGGWRVVDVLADGSISRIAVQRSDFRRLLSHGGAPALVASLTSKSQDLSDGVS
ncbi:MAG TPA: ABC transporter substrate-binding protein [Rhodopila sp.]|jgi:phospholipid transport system substrate-binding protein|nr:ABC transporter substrate-binding protein [Rhodopila sp.]